MTSEIPLDKGMVALVDADDHQVLSAFKWHAHKEQSGWYAARSVRGPGPHTIKMHRIIMNAPGNQDVDHINGNGLDNRKCNLRLVGDSENQQNRHRLSANTSGYRGVTWHKQCQKWQAGIKRHGKTFHLGLHATREEAARAYDEGARRIYGPGARTNFTQGEPA